MMTALKSDLIAQDPSLVGQITEALERLAQGGETEADRNLFDLLGMVSIGIDPDLLVATAH